MAQTLDQVQSEVEFAPAAAYSLGFMLQVARELTTPRSTATP